MEIYEAVATLRKDKNIKIEKNIPGVYIVEKMFNQCFPSHTHPDYSY